MHAAFTTSITKGTRDWHHWAAMTLLESVEKEDHAKVGEVPNGYHDSMNRLVARAQVHATLAMSAPIEIKEDA